MASANGARVASFCSSQYGARLVPSVENGASNGWKYWWRSPSAPSLATRAQAQSLKRMPCLKVAEVSRMNRASSMPRNCKVVRMVGNVASPTPMMPTSGDSSRVISRCACSAIRKDLAR